MLIAAAVCPNPPVLIPELASGLAHDLDGLRDACETAVDRLFEAEPEVLVIVGGADGDGLAMRYQPTGSFRAYGVDLPVDLGTEDPGTAQPLPLSLLVAGWLLRDRPLRPTRIAYANGPDASAEFCVKWGRALADDHARMAMLVMGDGSARRSVQAPGHFDERAAGYDAAVAAALASADHAALAAIDATASAELMAAGRTSWQVLAGAAEASGGRFSSGLLYDEAPYGVGYFVASWLRD